MELKKITLEELKYGDNVLIKKNDVFYVSKRYDNNYFVCFSAEYNEKDIDNDDVEEMYLLS